MNYIALFRGGYVDFKLFKNKEDAEVWIRRLKAIEKAQYPKQKIFTKIYFVGRKE